MLDIDSGSDSGSDSDLSLKRLGLTQFRNYSEIHLELDPRPVALYGPNGAGKTNILEALSMLAPGRGLRRAALDALQHQPKEGVSGGKTLEQPWAISATVMREAETIKLGTGLVRENDSTRRIVRIDGETVGQTAFSEVLTVSWLTPQMDGLFTGSSSDRRRFFDRLTYGYQSDHSRSLTAYEKNLRQRNKLLKDNVSDMTWFDSLEHKMAESAVVIHAARQQTLATLNGECQNAIGPFPAGETSMSGEFHESLIEVGAVVESENALESLKKAWRDRRSQDQRAGMTLTGPHRDDFEVLYRAKNCAAAICSTGEQKALLIAIILANARALATMHGVAPVVLLDEVAAHLDRDRRAALFDEICALGTQCWMTGTEQSLFEDLGSRAQMLRVCDAAVEEVEQMKD